MENNRNEQFSKTENKKPSNKVKVAAIQTFSKFGEKETNIKNIEALVREASKNGAKIIALPECCINGYVSEDLSRKWKLDADEKEGPEFLDPHDFAEDFQHGKTILYFGELSKELGIYLTVPIIEINSKGLLYQTVCIMNPAGKLIGHYRKQKLWESADKGWASKGEKSEVIDTEYGRIGVCIGNDFTFMNEAYQNLNCWLTIWCTAWKSDSQLELHNFFQQKIPDWLATNAGYTLVANWSVSEHQKWNGYGYSSIYGPRGKILACSEDSVGSEIVCSNIKTGENKMEEISLMNSQYEVKVASIQASSDLADIKGNVEKFTKLVEIAAANGAKFIVLPEAAITGYLSQDLITNWRLDGWPLAKSYSKTLDPTHYAETVPGPSTSHFAELAKKLKVYITVPLVEKYWNESKEKYVFYNTVSLVSPKGEIVAHYRKNNPWPYPEQSWATAGTEVAYYDTEYGRVGLAICFDIHTMLDKYKPHNLWTLLYPIAWVDGRNLCFWFHDELPSRLKDYDHHVVGCNWSVDNYQNWFGYGSSTIYEKGGKILATAATQYGSEIVYANLPYSPL